MFEEPIIEVLKRTDKNLLQKMINRLNDIGIASDEDGCGLSTVMIKRWKNDCEDYLRKNGYFGGNLLTHGNFFAQCGQLLVLFNSELYDYENAMKYMENYIRKNYI